MPILELDDWTWGEMLSQIDAYNERKRRESKVMAAIAAGGARYVASYMGGGRAPDLAEVFPFWSDEEVKELKLSKYRKMMEKLAAGGGA